MRVRVIKKNIFRDGKLHKVGSEMTLQSKDDFDKNLMERLDKPKRGRKPKHDPDADLPSLDAVQLPEPLFSAND